MDLKLEMFVSCMGIVDVLNYSNQGTGNQWLIVQWAGHLKIQKLCVESLGMKVSSLSRWYIIKRVECCWAESTESWLRYGYVRWCLCLHACCTLTLFLCFWHFHLNILVKMFSLLKMTSPFIMHKQLCTVRLTKRIFVLPSRIHN